MVHSLVVLAMGSVSFRRRLLRPSLMFGVWAVVAMAVAPAVGQITLPQPDAVEQTPAGQAKEIAAPDKVEVQSVTRDEEIAARLQRILKATGWFDEPQVRVDEGVVFLGGRTETEQYKKWAGDLGRNTQDVVAVVNQIDVAQPSVWNFAPAFEGIRELGAGMVFWFPYFVLALVILLVTFGVAMLVTRRLRPMLAKRVRVSLLREVVARGIGILIFLLGLYIVLRISGLTRLALTVIGGTGLFGLILGIAFRDIAENFLASILLSVQSPFRTGDLVEIAGESGIVQQLNVRTTVLMSLSGHHIQLPNSIVYKSTIRNYTSNPNRREDFTVGIGYDVKITRAQETALKVLEEHPAVLKSPEPWVLVESLGASTVNLTVVFWLDGSRYSWRKVRSSAIRLVKRAFQDAGITMPDEARELVFPQGVDVRVAREKLTPPRPHGDGLAPKPTTVAAVVQGPEIDGEQVSARGEAGLNTEAGQIKEQAEQARTPEEGENLLPTN